MAGGNRSEEERLEQRRAVAFLLGDGPLVEQLLRERVGSARESLAIDVIPEQAEAIAARLGAAPEKLVSVRTARALAMLAWQQAFSGSEGVEQARQSLGVAAVLGPLEMRERRPQAPGYLALQSLERTVTVTLWLDPNQREPAFRLELAVDLMAGWIAGERSMPPVMMPGELFQVESAAGESDWRDLLANEVDAVCLGELSADEARHSSGLIFPGSFNPLHAGHCQMAQVAADREGRAVEFELSVANVEKPLLDYHELTARSRQFGGESPLWLTRAATFVEKASLFPGATFIVGADTVVRIADDRFYGQDSSARDAALRALREQDCRLLVFGREHAGSFQTLEDLSLPTMLKEICDGVSQADFQHDLSSSQLRRGGE